MKENFTYELVKRMNNNAKALLLFAFVLSSTIASAQCPLSCNNNVQVSLDENCMALITPDMILEDPGPNCDYSVGLFDANDNPVDNPVSGDYIGQTLTVGIYLGNNECWGSIFIEDKLDPIVECVDDIFIGCNDVDLGDDLMPDLDQINFNPVYYDNCDNDPELVILEVEPVDLDCNDESSYEWIITYTAIDESGNDAPVCQTSVFFERRTLDDVTFPIDYNDTDAPSLSCEFDYPLDENGNISPILTGAPEIDGETIYPNDGYCEINVSYSDQILPICGGSYKILRLWTVLDWCQPTQSGVNPIFEYQVIKVLDKTGPSIAPVPDDSVDTEPHMCSGNYSIPVPEIIDLCSEFTYTVEADQGTIIQVPGGGFIAVDLPIGQTTITYIATDVCGNVSERDFELSVEDNTPPIAVCDHFTVVTIGSSGSALIYATTFDDGSYDNCSDITLEARRFDNPDCPGFDGTPFGPSVPFTCCDIGEIIQVQMRVTDESGNTNICNVQVEVQDKLSPIITCPNDVTIGCLEDYEDLTLTGEATAYDNCNATVTFEDNLNIGQCNTGTVTRTWTAEDDFGRKDVCVQVITIVNYDPFDESDIQWPPNITINDGCMNDGTDPSETGAPVINEDQCDLVAVTYEDQVFNFIEGACLKILRTWTIIDWCQFDAFYNDCNEDPGIWCYTQVIKLNDTEVPEIISNCDDRVEEILNGCSANVLFSAEAEDGCTSQENIDMYYTLDINNDGFVDFANTIENGVASFTRELGIGEHRVTWIAEDHCGNLSEECSYVVTVVDGKAPTPYCLGGINTVLMPSTGTVEIWASDYDLGSFDNCPGPLTFTIRKVGSTETPTTGLELDCDDIGTILVEIWVTDIAGNSDFCTTMLNIQSNDPEACPDTSSGLRVAGYIQNESDEMIEEVVVMIENQMPESQEYYLTQVDGHYEFDDLDLFMDYEVSATRTNDWLNGVSTLDLVMIQRHILSIDQFDSAYKMIAADINSSGSLSAIDLVQLRKLILGVTEELPNNESWRFVDATQTFDDHLNPWPFRESITLEQLVDSDMDNDFIAVKIGDVNQSATVTSGMTSSVVRNNRMNIIANDVRFESDQKVDLNLESNNFSEAFGFQFSIEFDPEKLEFLGINSDVLEINESNISIIRLDEGIVSISWNEAQAQSFYNDEVFLQLNFEAKSSGSLAEATKISKKALAAEIYDASLNTNDLQIIFRANEQNIELDYQLLQNRPNPFVENTEIGFILPIAERVTISVFDLTGKVLKEVTGQFDKGLNVITIEKSELNVNGVMYYQISTDKFTATKKMIVINK